METTMTRPDGTSKVRPRYCPECLRPRSWDAVGAEWYCYHDGETRVAVPRAADETAEERVALGMARRTYPGVERVVLDGRAPNLSEYVVRMREA